MSRNTYIVLVLVLAVYALLAVFHPGGLMAYALPSVCWGVLALIALWISGPRKIRQWFDKQVSIMAVLVAALQVFILIDAGVFTGFGKSPYSFTPLGITINIIFVYTALLGTELTRAYLIKNFSNKKPTLTIGLIALLYTVILTPITRFSALDNPVTITLFLSSILLPLAAENLLSSYLAFQGGPIAALAYRAPLKAFYWFSPILPRFPWYVNALIGIVAPTAGFLIITYTKPPSSISTAINIRPPSTIKIQLTNTPKPHISAKQDENKQKKKKKKKTSKKTNKKLAALFFSILITFSMCTLALAHWSDTLDISATVTTGNPRLWIWQHGGKVWPDWQVGYWNQTQTLFARIANDGAQSAYVKVDFIVDSPWGVEHVWSNYSLVEAPDPLIGTNVFATVSAEYHPPGPGHYYVKGILYYSFDTINWKPWYPVQDVLGGQGVSRTASSNFKARA